MCLSQPKEASFMARLNLGRRRRLSMRSFVCAFSIVAALMLTDVGLAATYYLSPTGADGNAGPTSAAPWRTFAHAIPRRRPGDTLTLLDGVYDSSNSGALQVSNVHGTAMPITIKALNERKAWLKGDATRHTLFVSSSSFVIFDGLRVSSTDNPNSQTNIYMPIAVYGSSNLVFKNMLVHNVNRFTNSHLIFLDGVTNTLMQDSELYFFNRYALALYNSNGNTFRRIYCNSRYGDIPGGRPSGNPAGGDGCISIYPGSDNLVENLISDGVQVAFSIEATGPSDNNRFFGIVSLNGLYGATLKARGSGDAMMPHNT